MGEQAPNNPFAALLSATAQSSGSQQILQSTQATNLEISQLESLAQDVFFITCKKNSNIPSVFLECTEANPDITWLGEALFERLLLTEPENYVIPKGPRIPSHVIERRVISYLHESWCRLQPKKMSHFQGVDIESLIMRNIATSLIQPDLYEGQNLVEQFLQLLLEEDVNEMVKFMSRLVQHLVSEEGDQGLNTAVTPILDGLTRKASAISILTLHHGLLRAALVMAKSGAPCAALLLRHSAPRDKRRGKSWAETLIGYLLSPSCLPGSSPDSDTLFSDLINQQSAVSAREGSIHIASSALADGMHAVFEALLRSSPENRVAALDWLWGCLDANASRGKLWSTTGMDRELTGLMSVPDGFALNLEGVVLRLCAPFCCAPEGQEMHPKLLTVDPSFSAVESGPFSRGELYKQTCLMPTFTDNQDKEIKRPHSETFTFVTESFFLAQRAGDLGSRVAREKLSSLNQDTARMERLLHQVSAQGSEATDSVRNAVERAAGQLLAYRTALNEPTLVEKSARLQASTASWLVQLLLDNSPLDENKKLFAPGKIREVVFPLHGEEDGSTPPAQMMQYAPEFLVENLSSFLVMSRKFHPNIMEQEWLLWPCLTVIIALMGSPGRVKNPHLRAKLAEVLEALLPWQRGEEQWLIEHQQVPASRFQRERLFKEHPHRAQLAESLVQVFVGIEMTGQSVQFEQKFNYRRPMYVVLEHLWGLPEHKACFRRLARIAQENMEAVHPPVFLRFANLLVNDAVYLLDEALVQMAQLRQKQAERDSGQWESLPAREREQNISYLEHMGMIARFHNILGRETIHTLEMLTSEIRSLFCHPTMVDRMAAMLNYFLMSLVGPKSKTLKVHNMKEYEFEPGRVVLDICRIYNHLGSSDEFCAAVSRDGRSYNAELFPRAETVLARVGGGSLLADMQVVAQRVAQHAEKQSCEDELLSEAPDEFLDPITAALMTDPVILPSSQVSIDRPTIARHLLSDQSDPFNRSPLTMDQVIPNDELRQQIEAWIQERHNKN